MFKGIIAGMLSLPFLFGAPSSTNYSLQSYDFGSGGTDSSTSTNYNLNGLAGAQEATKSTSTNFTVDGGQQASQTSGVPSKPTLTNPDGYYDRLKLVVNGGSNPSDTRYLIAISSDGFTTTRYVQTDNSIGASYTLSNYQTVASWGGVSGFFISGLTQGTTYEVKIRALQGNFSESGYSPLSDAVATLTPSLTFGVTTTLSGSPPFVVGFSSLTPNTVFNGDADATIALSSNARLGGTVYIKSQNAGLTSTRASYTLLSSSTDLASAQTGYGAQVTTATQTTGGPFSAVAPFNVSGTNVGGLTTALQPILGSSDPVFTASGTVRFKAKTEATTPSETDYSDTVTFIASMNY